MHIQLKRDMLLRIDFERERLLNQAELCDVHIRSIENEAPLWKTELDDEVEKKMVKLQELIDHVYMNTNMLVNMKYQQLKKLDDEESITKFFEDDMQLLWKRLNNDYEEIIEKTNEILDLSTCTCIILDLF